MSSEAFSIEVNVLVLSIIFFAPTAVAYASLFGQPSLGSVINSLLNYGAKISAFDPVAMTEAQKVFKDIEFSSNLEDCLKDSYCVVLLSEWSEFRSLSSKYLSKFMKGNCVIDFRNALDLNNKIIITIYNI